MITISGETMHRDIVFMSSVYMTWNVWKLLSSVLVEIALSGMLVMWKLLMAGARRQKQN